MKRAYDLAYWDTPKIKDALAYARDLKLGKSESMLMAAPDYADLRKLGRDVMIVNTKAGDLNVGFMGTVYGVSVCLRRAEVQGVISLFGPDEVVLSHVVNPRRWSGEFLEEGHSVFFHPGQFSSCPDGLCLAFSVIGS